LPIITSASQELLRDCGYGRGELWDCGWAAAELEARQMAAEDEAVRVFRAEEFTSNQALNGTAGGRKAIDAALCFSLSQLRKAGYTAAE
jgi:hypothetical protein